MSSIAYPDPRLCPADTILEHLSASAVGIVLTPARLDAALAVVCRIGVVGAGIGLSPFDEGSAAVPC